MANSQSPLKRTKYNIVQIRNKLNSQKLCVSPRLLCVPLRLKKRSFLRLVKVLILAHFSGVKLLA